MNIKKGYEYLFYKLFRLIEFTSYPKFWSEWKAIAMLIIIEILFLYSLAIFFHYITGINIISPNIDLPAILIIFSLVWIKYYYFENNDRWKEIVKEFDKLPVKENKRGSIVVSIIIMVLVFNLFFAISLLPKLNY